MMRFLIFSCLIYASATLADEGFEFWLSDLKQQAELQGVSPIVIEETLANASMLPRVVALDRAQPEFITPFLSYVEKRVTPSQIARGLEMQKKHAALLKKVERQYQVPQAVLLAFWGLETNYGSAQGGFNTPSALLTLAYDGRRAEFFRDQLLDAMRIMEAGHITRSEMRGSWAGAMGHMQFMPSTFLKYGVDANEDGRIDVWKSVSDAFASAANYLASVGWRYGEPIALEVQLPANFAWQDAQLQRKKSISEWKALNVTRTDGSDFPAVVGEVAIVLPQGWQGPAFMVFDNFNVVMDWNKSINYALSVALLAQQIEGEKNLLMAWGAENDALSFKEMFTLQTLLNQRGFDSGKPDGFPGTQTQAAIRQYQLAVGLKADGYASPSLLKHIGQNAKVVAKQE